MAIYLLGFVGLAAFGLLPLRAWQALSSALGRRKQAGFPFLNAIAAVTTVGSLWIHFRMTTRLFRCLIESYCGPGIASGWTYLAVLGAAYVGFETVLLLARRLQ
jgi:hypothetical protein